MTEAVDWRAEPKVELHLHLEGAAPVDLTRRLAAEQGAEFDALFDEAGGYRWTGFLDFLKTYDRVATLYASPDAERLLTEAVLRECAAHGVIYAEIIVSPGHAGGFAGGDPARWSERLAALREGAAAAEARCGIVARFVATGVRQFGPEAVERAARLAVEAGAPEIVGFHLAGDENAGRASDFARAFAVAREGGLGLAAHAGEFGGPESVRAALDDLRVDRLGHGVRAVEDPALVARLAEERTPLECCPGSNVALGVYPGWAGHPLGRLAEAGCRVTISTDDPPFFHTDMTREYAEAARAFSWDAARLRAVSRDALEAAFCDEATKARLRPRLA